MKKTLLPLSLSLVVVFLAGCANSNARKVSDKNVYLMQAATGLNIASGVSTSSKMINRSFSDQDKNDIKEILPTLDMMFDNNSLFTSTINEVNVDIDGKNYQYEEVIKYVNSSLEEGSYRLVYNIDKNNLEEDQDDGEVEQESLVSGLAFIDESISYPFYSKLEKETEDDEHEEERIFVINTSETSQIIIKEEFEVEGHETEIRQSSTKDGIKEFLYLKDNNNNIVLTKSISHYCNRDAMNIVGLSEKTIEKFVEKGFIKSILDIYSLDKYKKEIIHMEGFGLKSYNKLIDSIEKSKQCKLENFIYALGIPNVGLQTAKNIVKFVEGDATTKLNTLLMNLSMNERFQQNTRLLIFGEE